MNSIELAAKFERLADAIAALEVADTIDEWTSGQPSLAEQPADPHQLLVTVKKDAESLQRSPYRETMDYFLGREMQQIEEFMPILQRALTKLRTGGSPQPKQPEQKPQDWMASKQVLAAPPAPMPPKESDKQTTLKVLQKIKQTLMRLGEPDLLAKFQAAVGNDFKKLVEFSQMIGTAMQRLQGR